MVTRLEAVYCDGWDTAVVNPLTPSAARTRDAAGDPYTVVLVRHDRPHAVLNISWNDGYCQVSRLDAAGRESSRHILRRTHDGDMFLREKRTWEAPAGVGVHEYRHVARRTTTTFGLSGRRTDIVEPHGDRGSRHDSVSQEPAPRLPVPAFGRWEELLRLAGEGTAEIADAERHQLPVRTGSRSPWRPPRPLAAVGVERLFTPDATAEVDGRQLRLAPHPAGHLRLGSGRLVATDPSSLEFDAEPFTVTVPPGTYPVTVSVATFVDEPEHRRVCAARLDVGERPAVRWEMALRDSQDPVDLGHGEFFGFGVDAGMACFVDVDVSGRLKDVWQTLTDLDEPFRVIDSGDMVVWQSGWGDGAYPTWIGYDDAGAATCFVADMLLFSTSEDEDD